MHFGVGAERDDQRRHQHEWQETAFHGADASAVFVCDARTRPDDRLDDPALTELVAWNLLDDAPARHDDDPVADACELDRVARLHDRGDALVRLRTQCLVDVEARTDVDSLRRLLGEDDLDVAAQERADEGHLLLVAARQGLDGLLGGRHANAQALDERSDRASLRPAGDDPAATEAAEHLDGGVRPDAQHREQRLAASVAAQQDDPGSEGAGRRASVELDAAAGRAAGRRFDTGEGSQERHLAVPLGARDAEDLALADDEVDRAEAVALQAGQFEHDLGFLR